jgi:hypothetical protein
MPLLLWRSLLSQQHNAKKPKQKRIKLAMDPLLDCNFSLSSLNSNTDDDNDQDAEGFQTN